MRPKGFLVMGVSGSGKTTLGKALAQKIAWDFLDADDFHPQANVDKMAAGMPLSDSDRLPWLALLHDQLLASLKIGHHPILACSALKKKYRAQLLNGVEDIATIVLKGGYELIRSRMSGREGHFMKPNMLQSQFDTLEEPDDALILDISKPLNELVDTIIKTYFS